MGIHADMRIISFGPEKPVSAIRGGALLLQSNEYSHALSSYRKELLPTPLSFSKKLARTQIVYSKLRSFYPARWTKAIFVIVRKYNPMILYLISICNLSGYFSLRQYTSKENQKLNLLHKGWDSIRAIFCTQAFLKQL